MPAISGASRRNRIRDKGGQRLSCWRNTLVAIQFLNRPWGGDQFRVDRRSNIEKEARRSEAVPLEIDHQRSTGQQQCQSAAKSVKLGLRAIRLAHCGSRHGFFDRSADTQFFKRGMDAHNHPDFYRQLRQDPDQIIAAALQLLARKFILTS
jgi:hypothetical protein